MSAKVIKCRECEKRWRGQPGCPQCLCRRPSAEIRREPLTPARPDIRHERPQEVQVGPRLRIRERLLEILLGY